MIINHVNYDRTNRHENDYNVNHFYDEKILNNCTELKAWGPFHKRFHAGDLTPNTGIWRNNAGVMNLECWRFHAKV